MKKTMAILLAVLLVVGLSACGTSTETDGAAVSASTTELPASVPGTILENTETTEPGTEAASTETQTERTTEAAADPTTLSKADLVSWFNDRMNEVRVRKPKISRSEIQLIDNFKTSLIGGALDNMINKFIADNVTGEPVTATIQKGASNASVFFSKQEKFALKASDATSITARKEGDNYVVTLQLGKETNPAQGGASAYSRLLTYASSQEVLDGVAAVGLTGEVNKMTNYYYDGRASITVNRQGEIIGASSYYKSDSDVKDAKLSIFTFDLVVTQHLEVKYSNFVW